MIWASPSVHFTNQWIPDRDFYTPKTHSSSVSLLSKGLRCTAALPAPKISSHFTVDILPRGNLRLGGSIGPFNKISGCIFKCGLIVHVNKQKRVVYTVDTWGLTRKDFLPSLQTWSLWVFSNLHCLCPCLHRLAICVFLVFAGVLNALTIDQWVRLRVDERNKECVPVHCAQTHNNNKTHVTAYSLIKTLL